MKESLGPTPTLKQILTETGSGPEKFSLAIAKPQPRQTVVLVVFGSSLVRSKMNK